MLKRLVFLWIHYLSSLEHYWSCSGIAVKGSPHLPKVDAFSERLHTYITELAYQHEAVRLTCILVAVPSESPAETAITVGFAAGT